MSEGRKPYTLLFITTGLNTGGAEMMLCNIIGRLDPLFCRAVVISLGKGSLPAIRLKEMNVELHFMSWKAGAIPSPTQLAALVRQARQINPDIVQGWMYHGNLAARFVSRFLRRGIPMLWSIHHSPGSGAGEKRLTGKIIRYSKWLSRRPDKIIYVSEESRKQHGNLGFAMQRSVVIENGIDTNRFIPALANKVGWKTSLGLDPLAFLIAIPARFHPMKDHGTFIRAAAQLQKTAPEIHFLIAGIADENDRAMIGGMISENRVINTTIVAAFNQAERLIAVADIVTLSSTSGESSPLAILEAMSCELPCVATDVGDISIIIGDTGIVVPDRDPDALAKAWLKLFRSDDKTRAQLGKKARDRVVAHYSIDSVVNKYSILYQSLLKS